MVYCGLAMPKRFHTVPHDLPSILRPKPQSKYAINGKMDKLGQALEMAGFVTMMAS